MEEAVRDRVAALRELRDLGWSLCDISNVAGISRPRLHRCCVFGLTGSTGASSPTPEESPGAGCSLLIIPGLRPFRKLFPQVMVYKGGEPACTPDSVKAAATSCRNAQNWALTSHNVSCWFSPFLGSSRCRAPNRPPIRDAGTEIWR